MNQDDAMINNFEAIVVGSGIGGLAAASVLTQVQRKKVLLIEKHRIFGGFTHTFSRKGFHWDVGLHYVGQMDEGQSVRRAFDFITRGQVQWSPMPSPFEVFWYPDLKFLVPANKAEYKASLIEQFPHQVSKIERYFKDIEKIPVVGALGLLPKPLQVFLRTIFQSRYKMAEMTLGEYLGRLESDRALSAVIASQWGDYGLPPSEASMLIHATIVNHYLGGAHYPVGGAASIADSICRIVREGEGQCLSRCEMTSLIIDKGVIRGIQTLDSKGQTKVFFAPHVFTNIGAEQMYHMIPANFLSAKNLADLKDIHDGTAAVTLYLGFRDDPRTLGVRGENYWIYDCLDHDEIFENSGQLVEGMANHCYLSFPSLKDPHATKHTAEVIAFLPFNKFEKWESSQWQKRPEDYNEMKIRISDALIDLVESRMPGFRDLIVYQELSSPLTTQHFTSHPRGQIYGMAATPSRLKSSLVGPRTPIKGLYQVGADVVGHGIVGAMMGGILSVSEAFGRSTLLKVMRA